MVGPMTKAVLTRKAVGLVGAIAAGTAVALVYDLVQARYVHMGLRAFMTDGIDSPLYGSDPLAARRGADALRREFAATEEAQRATAATAA